MDLRLAAPAELDAVGELTLAAYAADGVIGPDHPYAATLRDAATRAAAAELWVALDGADLLGTVTWCPPGSPLQEVARPGEGEFRMLAVDEAARGRGVGQALVELCLDRACDAGLDTLVLSTGDWMHAAHRLYERLGFRRLADRDWSPRTGICLLSYRRDGLSNRPPGPR
ncbi:GNAT family N-acetyltransferase [Agilicoccus flavus]|uniref:GNAT family N-acetyltransferase n=1 Tax=Agilicoccus flavus TaxID=2775968 RepID=UPI001CF6EF72|nr:GNAT family N-acetyltransferase [Agilicoccus flavus]